MVCIVFLYGSTDNSIIISVYYNSNINFGDVLNELLWMGGPLGMGKLGTQWSIMTKFLCKKFWVVHTASSWTYLWGIKAELSKCVIVLFKWAGLTGMHFIAGIGTGNGDVGGSFKFYNTGLGIDKQKVSIWKLIDVIKQKGGTPFAFWGVSGKKGWW